MPTAKKKPAARKSSTSKARAAKPAAKKSTTAKKVNTKSRKVPAGREQKLAEQALKLVDEAASVLRAGIRSSAETTAKSRIAAKKKANALLGKASTNLTKAIEGGAASLQNLLGKL